MNAIRQVFNLSSLFLHPFHKRETIYGGEKPRTQLFNPSKRFFFIALFLFSISTIVEINGSALSAIIAPRDPADVEGHLGYARVLRDLKRYDEALAEYQKALKEAPDRIDIVGEIAQLYYFQGELDLAIHELQGIPSDKVTAEISLLMGDLYVAKKVYDQAEIFYRRVLAEKPMDEVEFKLAELLSWQKRYDESLALYQELIHRFPTDMQLKRKQAMVLLWSGDQLAAREQLQQSLPKSECDLLATPTLSPIASTVAVATPFSPKKTKKTYGQYIVGAMCPKPKALPQLMNDLPEIQQQSVLRRAYPLFPRRHHRDHDPQCKAGSPPRALSGATYRNWHRIKSQAPYPR